MINETSCALRRPNSLGQKATIPSSPDLGSSSHKTCSIMIKGCVTSYDTIDALVVPFARKYRLNMSIFVFKESFS